MECASGDLSRDLETVLRDQRRYYALRDGEYDESYERQNAGWYAMVQLEAAFERIDVRGDVLELAAGTGVWTERLVNRVNSLDRVRRKRRNARRESATARFRVQSRRL